MCRLILLPLGKRYGGILMERAASPSSLRNYLRRRHKPEVSGQTSAPTPTELETASTAPSVDSLVHIIADEVATVEKELAAILARKEAVAEKARELNERVTASAAKVVPIVEPLIYLNVGGMSYHTPPAHLTKFVGSRLEMMFSGRHAVQKDDKGDYFIDRDGRLFKHVMNFLRDDQLEPPADTTKLRLLKQEFDYFGLPFSLPTPSASPSVPKATPAVVPSKAPEKPSVYSMLEATEARLKQLEEALKTRQTMMEEEKAVRSQDDLTAYG